jgi:hypothetical protein
MGRFLFVTAVGVWLGTVVSFSFVVLPAIHGVLREQARTLLHSLFPRYYWVGVLCGLISLAAVSLAPERPDFNFGERVRLAFPVVVGLLCTLVAQRVLLPRLSQPGADAPVPIDERLHRFSVMLNTTVLAMLILAMAAVATR